jgi:hypothetical protein
MALQNLFGELNLEATQQEMLAQMTLLLAAILDKLPRVDNNDRMMVSHAESNPTVALNNFGTAGVTSKPADAIPMHLANAGTMHIYNNIQKKKRI